MVGRAWASLSAALPVVGTAGRATSVFAIVQQVPERRPIRPDDPNLIVLPHISAPVDQGIMIPHPPRSRWDKLLLAVLILLVMGGVLSVLFFHATAFH